MVLDRSRRGPAQPSMRLPHPPVKCRPARALTRGDSRRISSWAISGTGRGKRTSLNSTCLTPKPLASSVYVHVPEAPSPHERSISVTFLFPSLSTFPGGTHVLHVTRWLLSARGPVGWSVMVPRGEGASDELPPVRPGDGAVRALLVLRPAPAPSLLRGRDLSRRHGRGRLARRGRDVLPVPDRLPLPGAAR